MNICEEGDYLTYIEIEISGRDKAIAEIDDRNPRTAAKFCQRLPIEAQAKLWGEEVYFEIPMDLEDENPSPAAKSGDISYWFSGVSLLHLLRSDPTIFSCEPHWKCH